MSGFFNSENWLWQGFGKIADYFLLSICWLLTSIPLLTVGTSSIALYDAVAHCVRGNEGHMVKRYFSTFAKELFRGIALTVLWAVVAIVLNVCYQILAQTGDGGFWQMVSIVYFCSLLLPLGMACWSIALESRFVYSFGQLLKNSLIFTLGYLPQTAAIALLFVLIWNVGLNFPFFVMLLPGLLAHMQSYFIEKVFQKYMPAEDEESIEEASETE